MVVFLVLFYTISTIILIYITYRGEFMNKNKPILIFQTISAIFVIILGTLLHFTYNWSNNNPLVGAFSAINESTWEHLKLIFFPMLITTIIGYFYIGKYVPNFLCAKTLGIITSILFIIIFFYTYTGILGTNFAFLNILTFLISVVIGEYVAYKFMISNLSCNIGLSIVLLFLLLFSFIFFTYFTPKIGLFESPVTCQYGIVKTIK